MATRTYTAASIINFVNNLINSGDQNWIITATGFNSVTATTSFLNVTSFSAFNFAGMFGNIQGDIDFSQFPTIPSDAKINRLKIRYALSYASDAETDITPDLGQSVTTQAAAGLNLLSTTGQSFLITPQFVNENIGGANFHEEAAVSLVVLLAASEVVYDFSSEPLGYMPYAAFVSAATFQSIDIQLNTGGEAQDFSSLGTISIEGNGTFILSNWEFEVTYNENPFQWEIEDAATPKKAGQLLTIRTVVPGSGAGGLDTVIGVEFGDDCVVPSIDFVHKSPDELTVYIPFCLHSTTGPITVSLIGDGRLWSDPIAVGPITIFFEDGSGIYTIALGKITDTLYAPERDGTTEEVKIPNPYARTGFVDG